jgi:hypothetical protein
MRWMNTSRKQARVRGCSARRICSTRAEALESARRNSTCNPFSMTIVAVKQYESKSLHRSLCNLAPFGVRRVPWSSKIIFRQEFSKYTLILWNRFSETNRARGGDGECDTLERSEKNPWTSLRLNWKTNSLSANGAAGIHAVEMSPAARTSLDEVKGRTSMRA